MRPWKFNLCHLSAVLINWRSSRRLEIGKYNTHLQGLEGWSQEQQFCQTDLGSRQGYEAHDHECHYRVHAGQSGHQAQPTWIYGEQVLPYQPDLLVQQGEVLGGWGQGWDVVYLDFRKEFDTVLCSILVKKLTVCGMDRWTLLWVQPGWMARPREL